MQVLKHKVITKFTLEIEKSMHSLCPTERATNRFQALSGHALPESTTVPGPVPETQLGLERPGNCGE